MRLGQRMGLISGGSWGIAAVVLWILGPVAERTGLGVLLHLVWLGYLAAALMTAVQLRRQTRRPSRFFRRFCGCALRDEAGK
ncbi:MAG: hypothetical protein BWY52_03145 [Chloroflexi bacterium ADurb.Bin325]|nr:MAG: hypothetical protein BWY52_03145 [Chloroflexi bacterium ADurb.Bin325]